ncbi:MAG: tetratricopeptide repeat protein [Flavobacteriales bacterium]|nr:tetratricopeptide repeat protein [Flavobacteriales bacterium]
MRNIVAIVSVISIGLFACKEAAKPPTESEQTLAQIDSLEAILFADSEADVDQNAGMKLVRSYAKFYQLSEKDSLAVDMLFKAGEVSMGIGQGNLAVKYFRTITEDHSTFHKAPEALFLSGFCEENLNKDTAQARYFYETFIKSFPNHKLAEDARFSIQNMGKSDEDLIRMFEENMKKAS